MGYRSEVVLIVGKEVMPQFMVTMAKSPDARALCFGEAKRQEDYEGRAICYFRGLISSGMIPMRALRY
jgi:hypothetical protein